jgi:hypothetical protein
MIGLTFEETLMWKFRIPGDHEVAISIFLVNGRILDATFTQDVYGSVENDNPLSATVESVSLNIRYIVAKLAHVISVAIYIGSLFIGRLLITIDRKTLGEIARFYKMYSMVLALSMGFIAITGVYGLYLHGFIQTNIGIVLQLFTTTPYGILMLTKLFIVSSMILLGLYASILIQSLDKVASINTGSLLDLNKVPERYEILRVMKRVKVISLVNLILALIVAFLGTAFVVLHLPTIR